MWERQQQIKITFLVSNIEISFMTKLKTDKIKKCSFLCPEQPDTVHYPDLD